MLLDYLIDFCDKEYSAFGTNCGCNMGGCNHPSGKCSGSCYNCLYQIHFPSRFDGIIKKQYDCTKMLYHYVCQYSYLYTTEILWALSEETKYINNFPYYHILSLGCGGCADLLAFDFLVNHNKIHVPISYLGYEINPLWEPIHKEIQKYYINNDMIGFCIPGYNDVFECFKTSPLSNANIIVISYLISYLYNTNQTDQIDSLAENIANNVISYKKQNLLMIINDVNSNNRGRNYFSHFEKAIKNVGMTITNSKYKYFDTGTLNHFQTNGFTPYKAKRCCFDIPERIQTKYHAQKKLNSTIQLILEVN